MRSHANQKRNRGLPLHCLVQVEEILSDTELRGTVLNSKVLGERKNCNLPGAFPGHLKVDRG